MKIRKLTSWVVIAGATLLSAQNTFALDSTFDFKTSVDGRFVGTLRLDETPSVECTHELIGKAYIGPTTAEEDGSDLTSLRSVSSTDDRITFRAANLPAVLKTQQGGVPRFYAYVQSTCGSDVIISEAVGRFIRCGRGKKRTGLKRSRVLISKWVSILDKKLSRQKKF